MATPIRLAVLLKPDDAQPALDRAAQYARVNPEIEVVAIRIVNNYKDSEIEQLRSKENAKFESLKRLYSSIEKFSFKVLFDKNPYFSWSSSFIIVFKVFKSFITLSSSFIGWNNL